MIDAPPMGPNLFPVGTVVRTVFHKAEIILWREAHERFHLEVWRSFTDYVCGHIKAALRGAQGLQVGDRP